MNVARAIIERFPAGDAAFATHLILRAQTAPHPNPEMKFIHAGAERDAAFCKANVPPQGFSNARWFTYDMLDPAKQVGCAICRSQVEQRAAGCFNGAGLLSFIDKTRVAVFRALAKRMPDLRLPHVYVGAKYPGRTFVSVVRISGDLHFDAKVETQLDWTPDMLAYVSEELADGLELAREEGAF